MDNHPHTTSSVQNLAARCHCGSVSLPVEPSLSISSTKLLIPIPLCHCSTCRHNTGLLCTSYMPIQFTPPASTLAKTRIYPPARSSKSSVQRHFCTTCGCHVFRSRHAQYASAEAGENEEILWDIATGTLSNVIDYVRISQHEHLEDTGDGGLSIWLTEQNHVPLLGPMPVPSTIPALPPSNSIDNVLQAHCACGTLSFYITRPNASSLIPHSQFPDLMIPYHSQDARIPNAADQKWWLRNPTPEFPLGNKYLAGTCACKSCRLTSGFEIQCWAFVPRANIFIHLPDSASGQVGAEELDFEKLRERERGGSEVLRAYESSPGVVREFCPKCGATVFWHDKWRPDVVDVSVGLLETRTGGARAEEWLDWWGERVSFMEDGARDGEGGKKTGGEGTEGWDLIPALMRGLLKWGGEKKVEAEKENNGKDCLA